MLKVAVFVDAARQFFEGTHGRFLLLVALDALLKGAKALGQRSGGLGHVLGPDVVVATRLPPGDVDRFAEVFDATMELALEIVHEAQAEFISDSMNPGLGGCAA